ncbi:MAG: hypothetical protein UHS32_07700, partial [Bacteroidaceae bacterium]|nr:hypothetical protein [Bacteroidaceae bacterium]
GRPFFILYRLPTHEKHHTQTNLLVSRASVCRKNHKFALSSTPQKAARADILEKAYSRALALTV